jgi:hypothetical protein
VSAKRGDALCTITLASSESKAGWWLVAGVAEGVDPHARPRRRIERRQRAAGRLVTPAASIVSMLMRNCIAKPRGLPRSRATGRAIARVAPPATAICACTRSTPSTSSVTVCSTCSRGLASMNAKALGSSFAGAVIDQELEGAEVVVLRGARQRERLEDACAQLRAQRRAGRDLDQLLVAALDRALAFATDADTAPVPSPMICTSMWRAAAISRST